MQNGFLRRARTTCIRLGYNRHGKDTAEQWWDGIDIHVRVVQYLSQIVPKIDAATSRTATSCTLTADVSCSI